MRHWLFLVHRIPSRPLYLRAKMLQRLTAAGAIAVKNSVYLLPHEAETLEDFQWIAQEIAAGGGEAHLLTDPDPLQAEAAMPGRSARWRGLSASVLQELLLGRLWGIRDDESSVQVHHDAAQALRAAGRPPGGTAVICPPLAAADIRAIAADGERVPRKSTSFAPKPRSGLVLRSFAYG